MPFTHSSTPSLTPLQNVCHFTGPDLEGDEFEEDAANLAAWQEAFQQHHYWALPLGPVLAVGLSTVRFRSNVYRWVSQEECHRVVWVSPSQGVGLVVTL